MIFMVMHGVAAPAMRRDYTPLSGRLPALGGFVVDAGRKAAVAGLSGYLKSRYTPFFY
ncbi:hypothetical protein [Neisseria shayeganii]|uniref:Uncharacterized protein n=1 Tax=Neisseria shayeganii TaxID=607712 RepID=A0A7D7NDA1_9NEIS|nr:hypothetical protein [Neisseria shayeganii]QMT41398.1 hypothetical protein H3L94_05065 [Neisseria shayeganii]